MGRVARCCIRGRACPTQTPYRKSFGFAESFIGGSARTVTPSLPSVFSEMRKQKVVILTYINIFEVVEMTVKCERCVHGRLMQIDQEGYSYFLCKKLNTYVQVNEYMRCLWHEMNPITFVRPEEKKTNDDALIEEYERERIP